MQKKNLTWHEKSKKELLKTVVMTVQKITTESPAGTAGNYIVMDAPDWVIVIPEIDGNFLMVEQWRHGAQKLSIEFPGGVIDKNETPEEAALRELKEETGYEPKKMTYLGSASPNPALMRNTVYFFAAEQLSKTGTQHLDTDEFLDYLEIPMETVFKEIGGDNYPHALMLAALFKYRMYKNI